MIKGEIKEEDLESKCRKCNEKEMNSIIRPCNHVCICSQCAQETLKCPICFKFIDYVDRIYLPNN
jgi:hypothetical protein